MAIVTTHGATLLSIHENLLKIGLSLLKHLCITLSK